LLPIIYYPLPLVLPEILPDVFTGRWKLWNGRLLPYWYFGVTFFAAIALGGLSVWAARRLPSRVSRHWPRLMGALALVAALVVASREPNIPRGIIWVAAIVGTLGLAVSFLWSQRVDTRSFFAVTGAGLLVVGAAAGISFINGWARWNFTGYEGKAKWPEYEALMDTASTLVAGRIQWEYDKTMNDYGSPMALMLFPYWTGEEHTSMEGLFFESSLTTPFHFLNQAETSANPSSPIPGLDYHRFDLERGIRHMELFGITYYVTYTPEAKVEAEKHDELTPVAATGPFTFYRFSDVAMVEAATFQPVVYAGAESSMIGKMLGIVGIGQGQGELSFSEFSLEWYEDLSLIDRWVAAEGPEEWERVGAISEIPSIPLDTVGRVSDVVIEDHRISFRTTAVGVPHLVKVSYFPNWSATGAEGPYHATPSFMMVIPTDEEVVLEFVNTWAENFGWLLSGLGL
jgi:hypothetical protein